MKSPKNLSEKPRAHPEITSISSLLGRESVHPFPARMAPSIVLDSLAASRSSLRVLDPMSGSGTVPALARSLGHRAMGVDVDPLAVLMARVWTCSLNRAETVRKAQEVLKRARAARKLLSADSAFPSKADDETRKFITYWFDSEARRQLSALAFSIERVRSEPIRDALWCAFSRLIVTKQAGASRAMDLSHSRPHRTFTRAPVMPFSGFESAAERVARSCVGHLDQDRGPPATIRCGDARDLPFADSSVDLVITSPPYLNAIDYMRCSKFSLVWMGYTIAQLRQIRAGSVGTEVGLKSHESSHAIREAILSLRLKPKLAVRHEKILDRYAHDMRQSILESARVLVPQGRAIYVVGENTVRGTFIRNAQLIETLAVSAGLSVTAVDSRELPPSRRYMPPPSYRSIRAGLDGRMRREVVLTFAKPPMERLRSVR